MSDTSTEAGMREMLTGVVEQNAIISHGYDEAGEERLMFAAHMTAADFYAAVPYQETEGLKVGTQRVAEWVEANSTHPEESMKEVLERVQA